MDKTEHDEMAEVLKTCPAETIISTGQAKQRLTMTGGNGPNSQNGNASNGGNDSNTTDKHHAANAKKNWVKTLLMSFLETLLLTIQLDALCHIGLFRISYRCSAQQPPVCETSVRNVLNPIIELEG